MRWMVHESVHKTVQYNPFQFYLIPNTDLFSIYIILSKKTLYSMHFAVNVIDPTNVVQGKPWSIKLIKNKMK